jgi:hypothetical protein
MIFTDLRKALVKLINESGLPIDAVYFILKDLMAEATEQYNIALQQEQNAAAAAQESQTEVPESEPAAANQEEIEKKEEE